MLSGGVLAYCVKDQASQIHRWSHNEVSAHTDINTACMWDSGSDPWLLYLSSCRGTMTCSYFAEVSTNHCANLGRQMTSSSKIKCIYIIIQHSNCKHQTCWNENLRNQSMCGLIIIPERENLQSNQEHIGPMEKSSSKKVNKLSTTHKQRIVH